MKPGPAAAPKRSKDPNDVGAMMEKMLENLLTAQEAAELLGTNASRVRQLVLEGKIAAVKKGNLLIVYKPSIIAYRKTRPRRGRPPSKIES